MWIKEGVRWDQENGWILGIGLQLGRIDIVAYQISDSASLAVVESLFRTERRGQRLYLFAFESGFQVLLHTPPSPPKGPTTEKNDMLFG